MSEAIIWPYGVLKPLAVQANPVPFTRGGGRSLGGLERTTRTDRGWWSIGYRGVPLGDPGRRRCWNQLRSDIGGKAGLVEIPVWSFDSAPWSNGAVNGDILTTHSDGATFGDGSRYAQPCIGVEMAAAAAIGATSVTLRLVHGIASLAGVRWSYQGALYETGAADGIDDDEWTVPISTMIRAPIPAGAVVEVARPTCLVHLASDRAMDKIFSRGAHDRVDVAFVEAVDEWNSRAAAAAAEEEG